MKEYEKLAREHIDYQGGMTELDATALEAYIAGFVIAREMSSDYLMGENAEFLATMIRNLGEKEV